VSIGRVRARDKKEKDTGKIDRKAYRRNIITTKREACNIIIIVHPFPNPISAKVDTVRPARPDGGPSERRARTPAGVATTDSVRCSGGSPAPHQLGGGGERGGGGAPVE